MLHSVIQNFQLEDVKLFYNTHIFNEILVKDIFLK